MNRLALGALCAGAISFAAFRVRALDAPGSVAAAAVGTLTLGTLGFPGAGVLLTFFVTSVALSRVGRKRKLAVLVDVDKHSSRNAAQVLANGGVAALCAALTLTGDSRFIYAFAGALAAATADTWGTEIGTLGKRAPRSILSGRPVAVGLSGGVSVLGTLGELAGAAVLALAACACFKRRGFYALALAGVAGALVDSVLGASLQSLRWCAECKRASERAIHECGSPTTPLRGFSFIDNDAVNVAATSAGALAGFVLAP